MTDLRTVVGKWLRIRGQFDVHSNSLEQGFTQLAADAEHSGLLVRLLAGKEPLPKPPPRQNSYPWYELVENGHGIAWEAGYAGLSRSTLVIDQGMQWEVLHTLPGGWRVRCTSNDEVYDVVEANLHGVKCWQLTRVE